MFAERSLRGSFLLSPSDVRAAFLFEWMTSWKWRRFKGMLIFGAVPILGALVITLLKIPGLIPALAVDILPFVYVIGYLEILLILLPLLQGTNLVSREAEAKTLTFLLIRPLSRASLLLGKFLGSWSVNSILLCTSWLISSIILLGADGFFESMQFLGTLPGHFFVICVGAFAYGALFMLIGLVAKRPALVGLFLAFGWENIIPFLPGTVRNFTVRHHLVGLLPEGAIPDGVHISASPPEPPIALIWLIGGSAVFLILSLWTFSRRDYS